MVSTKIASLKKGSVVLVSPTHGATAAVRRAALELGLEMHVYTARFEKHPTAEAAYFARDEEMIRDADRLVVFWNGCSPGTAHEVEYAKAIGKPIEICIDGYWSPLRTKRASSPILDIRARSDSSASGRALGGASDGPRCNIRTLADS